MKGWGSNLKNHWDLSDLSANFDVTGADWRLLLAHVRDDPSQTHSLESRVSTGSPSEPATMLLEGVKCVTLYFESKDGTILKAWLICLKFLLVVGFPGDIYHHISNSRKGWKLPVAQGLCPQCPTLSPRPHKNTDSQVNSYPPKGKQYILLVCLGISIWVCLQIWFPIPPTGK